MAMRLALALALAAGVAACGRTPEAPAPCAPAPTPTLRIATALPSGLGGIERASVSSQPFADASLLQLDVSGRPRPALAASWQASADHLTWTFTLREGLRAQNGEPLTASRIRDLLSVGLPTSVFQPAWRDVRSIEAPTPTTLVFHLARRNNAFLEMLAQNRLANHAGQSEWYAGPFHLVQETREELVYEPFRDVWSGPPTVGGLHIRFFTSPRAAWAAFLRNEADMFYDVSPDAVPLLEQNRDVQLFNTDARYIYILAFQQRHPILRDARVRRALNLAIDRDAIARRFFGNYTVPNRGPFAPAYWAADDAETPWPYDPATARALLKEATAGRTQPIELVCLTTNQFPVFADIAAALEAQLELVHVRLRIVTLSIDELYRRMGTGDFDLVSTPTMTGYGALAPNIFWHTPQPIIRTNYSAADEALDAMLTAESDDATRAAAREVLAVMHREPPAVFVVPIPRIRAVRRTWRVPQDEVDIRRTLPYWTLAEAPCASR
jgi:peptide/nickel transport system substrate-binding protein